MAQTKTKTIEMDNGIIVVLTVVDDGMSTTAITSVENMDVIVGISPSFIGGRPKNPQ